MTSLKRWIVTTSTMLAALLAGGTISLRAQGVTTGAITGVVTDENGQTVDGAQVQVINRATGYTTGGVTRENGRYSIQGLEVGERYAASVRRIGFQAQTKENIVVTLSQATRVDFALVRQAAVLGAVQVNAVTDNPIITPTHTGIGTTISDSSLRRLPSLNRNFTDFARLTPQISVSPQSNNGLSGGGVNARLNNIQIDGASSNDVFGLNSTGGQPGAQANGKAISLEAVKEYQVLLSPFDVRQGNFNGALINAVTKSGTNEFHGTGIGSTRNEKLERDLPFIRAQTFNQSQYDFSFGGPIVKDRAFFFFAPTFQTRAAPALGPYLGQDPTLTTRFLLDSATITTIADTLRSKYGIQAGDPYKVTNQNPLAGLFSKLDFNLEGIGSRLTLRNNYARADNDVFSRSTSQSNPTIAFSSNAYTFQNRTSQSALQLLTNTTSGLSNELIVGYSTIRDHRVPSVRAPQISVDLRPAGACRTNPPAPAPQTCTNPSRTGTVLFGADASSQANELDQNITEFTDNLTRAFGAHTITVGTKNQYFKIRNLFAQNLFGSYLFYSLDSLVAGNPSTFAVAKNQGAGLAAQFSAANYSGYAQDLWQPTKTLSVTLGFRIDDPVMNDKPFYNPVIDTLFHVRTDKLPSGNLQYSPRFGFNWDVTGDQKNQLRGGAGVFAGQPSFVFYSNAFGNTGAGVTQLTCGASADPGLAPAFSPDINAQSGTCVNRTAGGPPVGITGYAHGGFLGAVATVDPKFKNPQSARFSLGYDRALSPSLTLTLEGLYTNAMYQPYYSNANLIGQRGVDRNGRPVYADTILINGQSSPKVVTRRLSTSGSSFGLINLSNESLDYSYSLTGQLDKRFENGVRITGSYTHGHSYDVQSLTSDVASSNFRFGRTVGRRGVTEQYLGTSLFDVPNRVLLTGSYTFKTRTDVSFIYNGQTGRPYDYVYGAGCTNCGDLNGDGVQGNDLIYVPKSVFDPNEIRFQTTLSPQQLIDQQIALDQFINSTPCLRNQRGQILERNSCRTPWINSLDISLRQSLPEVRGNNLTLQLDVFNFLNLLNPNWGEQSFTVGSTPVNLLLHQGQTNATGGAGGTNQAPLTTGNSVAPSQGIFSFTPTQGKFTSQNIASNYALQLSLRYAF